MSPGEWHVNRLKPLTAGEAVTKGTQVLLMAGTRLCSHVENGLAKSRDK
jgi:hypothetical protein